jgi:lipoprotein-anchoring transpeptidase ErfK/SrfK
MRGIIKTMAKRRGCRRAWLAPVAMLAVSSVMSTACQGGRAAARQPRLVQVMIIPGQGSVDDRPDLGVLVSASGGRLTGVTVENTDGKQVAGYLNPSGTTWHSTWALASPQSYAVTATAAGPRGRLSTEHSTFRTSAPARTFTASVDMAPGETVGVGMPIMVTFNRSIHDKAQVERSFTLQSSKPVVGAWYWLDDKTVWFRPKKYWPVHDKVRFTAHLAGVRGANGMYGTANLSRHFNVGESLVTVASTSTHRMRVWVNGKLRFDWPISTGQPGDDTPDGNYLTIEKGNPVDMDSCSFGVCPGDPGYYNELVYDSVRFTWSGDYIHSAPWSVGEQGFTNVSHGCVNLAPGYAAWYYDQAGRGDPVTIVGSPVRGTWGDGWTIWFLPWKKLVKGSALKEAMVAGVEGSYFAMPGALTAPAANLAQPGTAAAPSTAEPSASVSSPAKRSSPEPSAPAPSASPTSTAAALR